MTAKKILLLSLAILLPVATFMFLKIFGQNEFNVPLLYQDGKIIAPENCDFDYTTPYVIPDSIIASLPFNGTDSLYVIYFEPALEVHMKRVSVEIAGASWKIVSPSELAIVKSGVDVLKRCILLVKPPHSIVLVDNHNRIRGYYDGSHRDEIDRLIVEMSIILKQY